MYIYTSKSFVYITYKHKLISLTCAICPIDSHSIGCLIYIVKYKINIYHRIEYCFAVDPILPLSTYGLGSVMIEALGGVAPPTAK